MSFSQENHSWTLHFFSFLLVQLQTAVLRDSKVMGHRYGPQGHLGSMGCGRICEGGWLDCS